MDKLTKNSNIFRLSKIAVGLMLAGQSFALGLGEVQVKSSLNQPLDASIPLQDLIENQYQQDSIRIKLASPDQHAKAGLRYPTELSQTKFDLFQSVDGSMKILIGTQQPVNEPLVTMLLEVEWSHGRLLKEVSMLLDPPGYQQLPTTPAAPPVIGTQFASQQIEQIPAPVSTSPSITGSNIPVFIEVPAALHKNKPYQGKTYPVLATKESYRPLTEIHQRSFTISNGEYGPVRQGDTLNEIARAAARGTGESTQKLAQEIYENNPHAFTGSVDQLKRGAILFIPPTGSTDDPNSYTTSGSQLTQPILVAQAPTSSDISTISDLYFDFPTEEMIDDQSEEAAVDSKVNGKAQKSLSILPPDETATKIAQDIAKAVEDARKSDDGIVTETETATEESLPAANEKLESSSGAEAETPTNTEILKNNPIEEPVFEEDKRNNQSLASPEQVEEKPLNIAVENNELPIPEETNQQDIISILISWLPGLLVILGAIGIAIFSLFRQKKEPEPRTRINPASVSHGLEGEPPRRQASPHQFNEETEIDADLNDEIILDKQDFDQDTAILGEMPILRDDISNLHVEESTSQPPTLTEHDDFLGSDDLQPTASDTQETIRPDFDNESSLADENNSSPAATMVLDQQQDTTDSVDADLDSAQEAEIYLAYGQYSLAEAAINKLRNTEPDSHRFKLLQIKLFAETGKLDQMDQLASTLLEQQNNGNEGLSQQIKKITKRAHSRFDTSDINETQGDSDPQNTISPQVADNNHTQANEAPETSHEEKPAFKDDFEDYVHQTEAVSEMQSLDNDDPLIHSLGNAEDIESDETAIDAKLDNEDLTDDEFDAISMELDLMDSPTPSDTFDEIKNELDSDPHTDEAIENFSDTDYRLTPLGRDKSTTEKGTKRLDIPFDLESELDKLSDNPKPNK